LDFASRTLRSARDATAANSSWRIFLTWQFRKVKESIADFIHNVDTFKGESEPVRAKPAPYLYDPTPWSALRRIFRYFRLDFSSFTFVDIGAGKGRIVLTASTYPFTSVIGVEHSPSLCQVANKNLEKCRFLRRRAKSTQIIECDATEFAIPGTPCVFFFYNPFDYNTMNLVITNIVRSYRLNARQIYLICVGMSTIFPEIINNSALKLRHSFEIPWRMTLRYRVFVLMVDTR
jgi:hypothetical protein